MTEAEAQFQKANSITDNPISTNNLAAITRQKGDRKKAQELLKKSLSAGPEVKYNLGLIDVQNGEYSSANGNFSGTNSVNAALAKMLGGDAAAAQGILQQASDKDSAVGHYVMAIIAARQNNSRSDAHRTGRRRGQGSETGRQGQEGPGVPRLQGQPRALSSRSHFSFVRTLGLVPGVLRFWPAWCSIGRRNPHADLTRTRPWLGRDSGIRANSWGAPFAHHQHMYGHTYVGRSSILNGTSARSFKLPDARPTTHWC